MNVLILQPPVMQLNTVYPSGAYLASFFRTQPAVKTVHWRDLNIELFYELFSRTGLERLFSLCADNALLLADKAEKNGDDATAFNLRRYVSERALWCGWIDTITALLRGEERESAHRFVFGAHVPRGSRMERYLAELQHDVTTDDARALASNALADLADFITAAFDSNFALVRYAESLTVSEAGFAEIAAGADSPVMRHFYLPVLTRVLTEEQALLGASGDAAGACGERTLVCVSVPFAGTFTAALATGRFFKEQCGDRVFVSLGGGFINTELRDCTRENTPLLANFCDALSYDRGYAGYRQLLEFFAESVAAGSFSEVQAGAAARGFYKLRLFSAGALYDEKCVDEQEAQSYERMVTSTLIPDFSGIDFSRYPRLVDDTNPMHRLWSDGAWIKVYMAHGCYWHQCAFCDVTLDYVCGYCPTDVRRLYESLLSQCEQAGVYGIHFVDEAMPPALMVQFARENIAHGSPLSWWGNIRFEKLFTRDIADYLAAGGLVGVSGGLEIATGSGLDEIHKGIDLTSVVGACCAFKEAGILVHAYMIYGYWKETPQDLVNSMETLRQFYANGLLDSSFWHKFVLTRHSRVYKEWKEGKFPELKPIEAKDVPLFAKNGLHFAGEHKSERFGPALDYSLDRWMHGEDLNRPVYKWFDFAVPRPSVAPDFIEKQIAVYERARDKAFAEPLPLAQDGRPDARHVVWLGGERLQSGSGKNARVRWTYMGELHEVHAGVEERTFRGRGLCVLPAWVK
ncbi:MAG: radical SAM protein [Treponema sp.]|nr:radical SAM protein [Treponema sp.]